MTGQSILIVDDDPDVREVMRQGLTHEGYAVIGVATGMEGIEACEQSNPQLIIIGLCLPEMSGYWRVPVDWIAQVTGATIRLAAAVEAVYAQPQWHGS